MNGQIKFHPPMSPAFYPGEIWYDSEDRPVAIMQVVGFPIRGPKGKWDYDIIYRATNGVIGKKDVWNFQVRYTHQADLNLKPAKQFMKFLAVPLKDFSKSKR